jgi:hypothetical protein
VLTSWKNLHFSSTFSSEQRRNDVICVIKAESIEVKILEKSQKMSAKERRNISSSYSFWEKKVVKFKKKGKFCFLKHWKVWKFAKVDERFRRKLFVRQTTIFKSTRAISFTQTVFRKRKFNSFPRDAFILIVTTYIKYEGKIMNKFEKPLRLKLRKFLLIK